MTKVAVGLTDAKIKGLKPPLSGQLEIPDKTVPGLRLRIGVSGAKAFVLRKRVAGKNRNITLGRYSDRLGLAEARKKARQLLSDIEIKADPAAALPKPKKKQLPTGQTIRALWPAYRQAKADRRRISEVERVFDRHILPAFGDRAADGIKRSEITRFIDDIAQRTPTLARNVLAYFSSFYGWALPRLDDLPGNPCTYAGRPKKSKSRERVLSEAEIGLLWRVLDGEAAPFGPAIKLLLLTGQRRNEVFEADRAEFDMKTALWTIPAHRAKNGVVHLVPLAGEVVALIAKLGAPEDSDKLFPARCSGANGPTGFSKAMTRIRAAMEDQTGGEIPHWTLHDLRRTMATGLQRLGVRLEVTEAVLNHVSGSRAGIVGVYQRHDYFKEKREALEAWSREVSCLAKSIRPSASHGLQRSIVTRAKNPGAAAD